MGAVERVNKAWELYQAAQNVKAPTLAESDRRIKKLREYRDGWMATVTKHWAEINRTIIELRKEIETLRDLFDMQDEGEQK